MAANQEGEEEEEEGQRGALDTSPESLLSLRGGSLRPERGEVGGRGEGAWDAWGWGWVSASTQSPLTEGTAALSGDRLASQPCTQQLSLGTYLKEIIKLLAKGVGGYQEVRGLPFVVCRPPPVGK